MIRFWEFTELDETDPNLKLGFFIIMFAEIDVESGWYDEFGGVRFEILA